jgi:ABC-type dipeptide/oligopeptide/nickel transport system ATPase component
MIKSLDVCNEMGPINLFMASRGSGKSVFNDMVQQLTQPRITVLDQALVDEHQWYTVDLDPAVAKWVRQQCSEHWYQHSGNRFRPIMDVHEHLYTMIRLKF